MNTLQSLLIQIETHIPDYKTENKMVSHATIGWQLDHSLLVINGIIAQLVKSNPKDYQWRPNWKRIYIKLRNNIPRGKAKAPKQVRPAETITIETLQDKLRLAQNGLKMLESLPKNSFFTHPYFGDLNLKAAIWFLKLHTRHHLKIVNDIINKG